MSLYGNVKKIGSSSFQFDRVYPNRLEMDNACTTDGVYAGRYVLVEYGERFGQSNNSSNTQAQTKKWGEFILVEPNTEYDNKQLYFTKSQDSDNSYVTYSYDQQKWAQDLENGKVYIYSTFELVTNENGSVTVKDAVENTSFRNNANTDLNSYGAVYDSTVWQKVFFGTTEKYIMVAELNAIAPKLDITQDSPLTYTAGDIIEDYTKGIVTGKVNDQGSLVETVRLINAIETYNKPYFDTAIDTELNYLMHFPTTLNLEIDNSTVNFNEKGFNMAYSYGEDDGVSSIAWVPKGLDEYKYVYDEGHERDPLYIKHDFNGNPLAVLDDNVQKDIDTKMLFMSFPALGNAMNALYNLLYGRPETGADLSEGALRPYFQQFLKGIENENYLQVYDSDAGKNVYVYINENGEPGDHFVVKGKLVDDTGAANVMVPILLEANQIDKTFIPNFVVSAYRDGTNYKLYNETTSAQRTDYTNWILYNTRTGEPVSYTFHIPTGNEDPDMEWLKSVPALSDILANNTAGLATILSSLFGDTDPLTGTVRYYLYNDWLAKESEDSSGPFIYNKPEVVGGYPTTFMIVKSNQTEPDNDAPNFETPGAFPNLGEDKDSIPNILYPHTEIVTSKEYSGGHYEVDFSTWQLVSKTS